MLGGARRATSPDGINDSGMPDGKELEMIPFGNKTENTLTKRSVYHTTRSQAFDLNQYTVKKGTTGWGNLQQKMERLENVRHEIDKNDEGEVPVALTNAAERKRREETEGVEKFGTWDGVFVACLLNIFGVIMFLRLPWMVGQAGIYQSILIILIANIVTLITAQSMSAICTNGEVRAGGAYYLISRSLGHRLGGPIGILFAFGQAVATALYVIGFCETMVLQLGDPVTGSEINDIRVFGLIVITVILIMAYIGLSWIVKFQVFLMGLMWVSIACVMIGTFIIRDEDKAIVGYGQGAAGDNFAPEYREGYDFFSVFGVFFPAVTGIMAGANKSGDLENPGVNIPVGTLWSILVSMIVYLILAVQLGATVERRPEGDEEGLYENVLVMVDIAVPYIGGPLVLAGIYAATFSSGLASIVGAPRILMSVAQDNLIPAIKPFAVVRERDKEPIRGYFLTYIISVLCILVGDLNAIAPLISMFFMITYGLVNLACFMLDFSKAPSWRPTFRFYNKWVSLSGFFLSLIIMFLTSWYIALASVVVAGSLYYYIDWRDPPVNWGSANQARQFYDVEKSMMRMRHYKGHVKTFRPHYLVMTGEPKDRLHLARFVATLRKGYGITIYGNVSTGGGYYKQAKEYQKRNFGYGYFEDNTLPELKVRGFFQTTIADTIRTGCRNLMCCSGLGVMRPNTLVLGFKEDWKELWIEEQKEQKREEGKYGDDSLGSTIEDYVGMIRDGFEIGMGLMVARNLHKIDWNAAPDPASKKTIDVWWLVDDGGLTCLIPYILSLHKWWKERTGKGETKTKVRLLLIVEQGDLTPQLTIAQLLKMFRIPWEDDIKTCTLGKTTGDILENYNTYGRKESVKKEAASDKNDHWMKVAALIKEESKDAIITFLTLPYPLRGIDESLYMSWLDELTKVGPTVLLRGNNENVLTFYLE